MKKENERFVIDLSSGDIQNELKSYRVPEENDNALAVDVKTGDMTGKCIAEEISAERTKENILNWTSGDMVKKTTKKAVYENKSNVLSK